MNPTTMIFVTLILLPALGVAIWAWFAMAQVEEEMRSFGGFEGIHFEIGPQAAENTEGARWPIPG